MSIPKSEAELVIWFKNFASGFAKHSTALGFTAAEVSAVQADAAMIEYLISDMIPAYKSGLDARYGYKNLIKDGPTGEKGGDPPAAVTVAAPPATVAPGVMQRLRNLIQRIRHTENYTTDIGRELGIEDEPGTNAPDATAKPTARAIAETGGHVRIEFNKRGFEGVWIEGRRKGEADWAFLGIDLHSPFTDTRPPAQANTPEVREYRLRYYHNDQPTGDWSDIISVVTTP